MVNADFCPPNPPLYDLSQVTVPVSLHVSYNDPHTCVQDVATLISKLKNFIGLQVRNDFNHIDFIWGKNAHFSVYAKIRKKLQQHFSEFTLIFLFIA